jgi:hypothetical protein
MDDHAAMQAENVQSATATATATASAAAAAAGGGGGGGTDYDPYHAAAKDVFDELASGTPFLSPSAFLEWDHVAAMVEEGIVDRARLVQLVGTAPLDWDAFYALVQAVDAIVEAGLVGGEGEGEDMHGDMDMDGVMRDPGTDQDDDHGHVQDEEDDYDEDQDDSLQVNDEFLQAVKEVFDELRGKDAKVIRNDKKTRNLLETMIVARWRFCPLLCPLPKLR